MEVRGNRIPRRNKRRRGRKKGENEWVAARQTVFRSYILPVWQF